MRAYYVELAQDHKPRGVHAAWRAISVWLRWCAREYGDPSYQAILDKVRQPRISSAPLPP